LLYNKLNLSKFKKSKGRKLKLSVKEIITLALYKQKQTIETKKALYDTFDLNCAYKTLVVNLNRFFFLALVMLKYIIIANRNNAHIIKHIDSTDIPVCLNKNAIRHKTMKAFANWGHSGKGLFYGIKLHITTDLNRQLLSFCFASGNKDDRSQFMKLNKDLDGVVIADAGYISKKLEKKFFVENKRMMLAKPKKNMKKLTTEMHNLLYDTRMLIELNFRSLKMFYGLLTSLPRSIDGYISNYIYSILTYTLR
jgi:hypothetical protein